MTVPSAPLVTEILSEAPGQYTSKVKALPMYLKVYPLDSKAVNSKIIIEQNRTEHTYIDLYISTSSYYTSFPVITLT